jgi:hypothetical protein
MNRGSKLVSMNSNPGKNQIEEYRTNIAIRILYLCFLAFMDCNIIYRAIFIWKGDQGFTWFMIFGINLVSSFFIFSTASVKLLKNGIEIRKKNILNPKGLYTRIELHQISKIIWVRGGKSGPKLRIISNGENVGSFSQWEIAEFESCAKEISKKTGLKFEKEWF